MSAFKREADHGSVYDLLTNGASVDTLLQRQLISLENLASGRPRAHVTSDGDSILKAVSRMR